MSAWIRADIFPWAIAKSLGAAAGCGLLVTGGSIRLPAIAAANVWQVARQRLGAVEEPRVILEAAAARAISALAPGVSHECRPQRILTTLES